MAVNRVASVDAALDGEAGREARRLIELDDRRRDGVFFTSSPLREFAFEGVSSSITKNSVLFDPACGAGDLLLAATDHMPLQATLAATLKAWSAMLIGCDLHAEFTRTCRMRLLLAAWRRHQFRGTKQTRTKSWFGGIRKCCGLANNAGYQRATHILMNPPFAHQSADINCDWASGKINSAAVFLMQAIEASSEGTRIVAILPEVIRCGTRYGRLRDLIAQQSQLNRIASFGVFDRHADVDVFVLDITTRQPQGARSSSAWDWKTDLKTSATVSKYFDVYVGSVVDYRDACQGRWFPYLTVNSIAPWGEAFDVACRRRFPRRVTRAPFVVIRRTSRPGDKFRAVGAIVRGTKDFAVDNHLIVCKPLDNTLRSCRRLVSLLREESTSRFLDQTIRCRHLTVDSIKSMPWVNCG
ncbi:MAG: N-6 DNA methylase [Planctomycetales bacterium]|nr:N-6 DNA methylase [Planctomycetales bacterium]